MIDYNGIEKSFNVLYPEIENATYLSQVNYSDELKDLTNVGIGIKRVFQLSLLKD